MYSSKNSGSKNFKQASKQSKHKIEAVFDEIQQSNMSKLGADGKPIYREDGKVMKGPNYFKPNFTAILK